MPKKFDVNRITGTKDTTNFGKVTTAKGKKAMSTVNALATKKTKKK